VLCFNKVAFSYSGLKKDYLYSKVDLAVDLDSRVALVGPNGAGKSTLLKLMTKDLTPTEGDVRRHLHLSIGRYHQHSMEVLDPDKTVLDFIRDYYPEKKNGGGRLAESNRSVWDYGHSAENSNWETLRWSQNSHYFRNVGSREPQHALA